MRLPLLISVPHAGLQIPPDVEEINQLSLQQIIRDGDEGAKEIYDIEEDVQALVTTEIARAFLDMNRPAEDLSADGVVKTETIYQEVIYKRALETEQIDQLISGYYHHYHRELSRLADGVMLGVDCHTMAAVAPPICSDAGVERPYLCLSNADGTCSPEWTELMADCLESEFKHDVSINIPFQGGHIIRSHANELPWLQLELSRASFMSLSEKRSCVLRAFRTWCERVKQP